jgi:hypothetical protein
MEGRLDYACCYGESTYHVTRIELITIQLLALPISIFTLVGTKLGLGTHIWDLRPEWYTPYWKVDKSKPDTSCLDVEYHVTDVR